jgi:hypothetical protein
MIAPDERFTLTLPDTWTPEQALAIFELLNEVTDAIWQSYRPELLSLVDPRFHTDPDRQPDLFDPDDPLPF